MGKALRILHLEDETADVELIQRFLAKSELFSEYKVVYSKDEYIEALKHFHPDLILSDHAMPQFTSYDALAIYREMGLAIPFILVTGTVSEEYAVSSIKQGADDYILKSNLTRLPSSIKHAVDKRKAEKEREVAVLKLYRKNEELNTLIYKTSHDLRTPIVSILGLIELSSKSTSVEEVQQYINMIKSSTTNLDLILSRFRENISMLQKEILKSPVSFDELIRESLSKMECLDHFKSIKFNVEVNLPNEFLSDEIVLLTIFQNLIHNAIRYRRDVDSIINIKVYEDEEHVIIVIKDNGIGIKEEAQTEIFNMFFRVHSHSGRGLGLYFVKNAVDKLGGSIHAKSVYNEGTMFEIRFPKD